MNHRNTGYSERLNGEPSSKRSFISSSSSNHQDSCEDVLPFKTYSDMKSDESGFTQWTVQNGGIYSPSHRSVKSLPPGMYVIGYASHLGFYFQHEKINIEGLVRFPHTNSETILKEIQTFWDNGNTFKKYGLPHKRGILLWGSPGSGKSCTVRLIINDVIRRKGIAIRFVNGVSYLVSGMRCLREINPDIPVVILMEDLDSIAIKDDESELLNLLDGVSDINKVVFLATTNYPEDLDARFVNRPSRFDKRFKIGLPTPESREIYLRHLIGEKEIEELAIDLERWVNNTEGMSLAHLKELFVAVVVLGNDYEDSVRTLKSMKNRIDSKEDSCMGFIP